MIHSSQFFLYISTNSKLLDFLGTTRSESKDNDDLLKRYRYKEYHNLVRKSVTKAKEMYEIYV